MKIWQLSEVLDDAVCRLVLCQSMEGRRYYRLAEEGRGSEVSGADAVFTTDIVPNELLRSRNLGAISEATRLEGGRRYFVDAHGVWLTEEERGQLFSGTPFSKIVWSAASPPVFAPR